jgi:rhodanese-related sulfurtransferase
MTKWVFCLAIVACGSIALQAEEPDLIEALEEYYLFAPPGGGSISYRQIPIEERSQVLFVDTRTREEYQAAHIPGAMHLEWRELVERREELPQDRPIILYCNSGASSAQAMMGLHLAGMNNVRTLAGGFLRYLESQADGGRSGPDEGRTE